jgi:glycerate kinase
MEDLSVAVDVQNPLLGRDGCTRVYGPQKGVRPEDFEFAERCLQKLADIAAKELHLNYAEEPGAGAAGGLGFGLRCFAGARLEPGFALFARLASLRERVAAAQLVITGEGAIDRSTLMGKGVGELARWCREQGVPCLGLAGALPNATEANQLFTAAYALAPDLTTPEEAKAEPGRWLERLAARVAQERKWKKEH